MMNFAGERQRETAKQGRPAGADGIGRALVDGRSLSRPEEESGWSGETGSVSMGVLALHNGFPLFIRPQPS
jgi:hypothetical protein